MITWRRVNCFASGAIKGGESGTTGNDAPTVDSFNGKAINPCETLRAVP